MRTFLLILTITLMPLRGWLGDAMAVQTVTHMVAGHTVAHTKNATENVATHAHQASATGQFDLNIQGGPAPCHGALSVNEATPVSPCDGCSDHPACQACEVCHTVALPRAVNALPTVALPAQTLQGSQTRFASVPRAPHLKPPIS